MDRSEIERQAFDLFRLGGFHCAESVCKTIVDGFAPGASVPVHKMTSGFGGGIGASHCDLCGALAGGVVALGWLYGRADPDDDRTKVLALGAELRNAFIEKYGATCCKSLLEQFGNQDDGLKCKKLTADTAGMLFDILQRERSGNPSSQDSAGGKL